MSRVIGLALLLLACGSPRQPAPNPAQNVTAEDGMHGDAVPLCVDEDPALTRIERPARFQSEDTGAWQIFGNSHVLFMSSGRPEPRTPVVSIQNSRGGGVTIMVRERQCGCAPVEVGEDILGPRWRRASEIQHRRMVWASIQRQLRAISRACRAPMALSGEETWTFERAFQLFDRGWR